MTTDPRYPIGTTLTPAERTAAIEQIAQTPDCLRAAIAGLNAEQLDTAYREGGWTVRQVVHHLPDGHMNAYVRFKLALTEQEPIVKTYDEALWAALPDARLAGVDVSLVLLDALHRRWVILLHAVRPDDFVRRINHPERGVISLDWLLGEMAWHGAHHVAHITSLRERLAWK